MWLFQPLLCKWFGVSQSLLAVLHAVGTESFLRAAEEVQGSGTAWPLVAAPGTQVASAGGGVPCLPVTCLLGHKVTRAWLEAGGPLFVPPGCLLSTWVDAFSRDVLGREKLFSCHGVWRARQLCQCPGC